MQREGTLIFLGADSLVLHPEGAASSLAIPVSAITKLEVHRGHGRGSVPRAATGAALGALGGAVLGAVAGAAMGAIFPTFFSDRGAVVGDVAKRGAAGGAAVGAIGGAYRGATVGPALWQEVTVVQLRRELCHCMNP
jgi:hypothetical protein